jgi:hypothetical protein
MPSPPLGRVWRQRSSEVGIFHSGGFAEYVSGGFVHFTSGDDSLPESSSLLRTHLPPCTTFFSPLPFGLFEFTK